MGSNLKILIYGEPYSWAMAYNLNKAFQEIGCKSDIFDYTQWLYSSKCASLKNRIYDRLFFHKIAGRINQAILDSLKNNNYSLFVVLKGIHIYPSTITKAKLYTKTVINWNPDDYFNPLNNTKYLLDSFSKYDCIFTPRPHLINEYYKKGAKKIEILNWYYLPDIQHPAEVESNSSAGGNITFIGSWSKRRERMLWFLKDFKLKIWGARWHKANNSFLKYVKCNKPVYSDKMCKIICASRINLNILTVENRDTTNLRNFEIPACGGFQLSEKTNDIMKLFEENKEIVFFDNDNDLVTRCKYYLDNEALRKQIALNGHRKVTNSNHTMLDRAKQILESI